jgi:hypothetical protein
VLLPVGILIWPFATLFSATASGQTNTNSSAVSGTNSAALAPSEKVRAACVEGRRYVCGKVVQIVPDGLVVDSGYAELLKPPFNRSWVVRGTASISRDPTAVEEKRPDAICIGLVFLTGTPKKPVAKEYDYVVIHAYPAGEYKYKPVPGVEKVIRRFSGSLERAVELNLEAERTRR